MMMKNYYLVSIFKGYYSDTALCSFIFARELVEVVKEVKTKNDRKIANILECYFDYSHFNLSRYSILNNNVTLAARTVCAGT